jgi:sigma-B regulation protein RsbU (phosphoserine phosphatase)
MEDQMNVTLVIGLISGVAKTLTLANAGHHAHPQLLRNGQLTPLVAKGMPLGMMVGISYREIEFQLQSGDVLVFMTDGIIEAKDNSGAEYQDTDRLQQVIAQFTADTKAMAMVSALINDATTFGADMTTEEEDDITVVVVKVL